MAVTVRLEPMTQEQYDRYRPAAEADYGRNIAESGPLAFEETNVLMTKRLDGPAA